MAPSSPSPLAPSVTVIIPAHNGYESLSRCLAGLASQRDINRGFLEIVLIDNNSTAPGFCEVVAPYRDLLPITVIHQPELPSPYALCRARNLGLAVARGDWIWTLDSDCIPHPQAASSLNNAINRGQNTVAFTGERIFVDPEVLEPLAILRDPSILESLTGVLSDSNYRLVRDRRFPAIEQLPDLEHPWDMMHGGNSVFRRDDALRVGGYDERFDGTWGYEDDEFAYRLLTSTTDQARFLEGLTVFHQESPEYTQARVDRPNKADNPNWALVCSLIPGYRDYKLRNFSGLGIEVEA